MLKKRAVGLALMSSLALLPLLVPLAAAAPRISVILVDDESAPGGDGSRQRPFNNLPDAVAAARTSPQPVVINVAPGHYRLVAPLVIDFPVTLRGSNEPVLNEGDPWPTGQVAAGTETRVFADSSVGAQTLIQIGRTDTDVLSDVSVSRFTFQGTATGQQMLLTRVQQYLVADNIFRAPGTFAFTSVASSGKLIANHFSGIGTGAIFNGGYPESPSNVVAVGNRAVGNNLGGILLNGASINIPELGDQLSAVVRANDLSGNTGIQGFGLRLFILRRDAGTPGDTQAVAHVQALAQDNRIVGNRVGLVVDAGFPYRSVAGVCDPRVFSGTIELELMGNTLSDSIVAPALITTTRSNAALTPSMLPMWQYLHGATFSISDRDQALTGAWIDHPAADPFVGPCPADATHETLENAVIYNGVAVPNGRNF
jgi:hypothetical protein